MADGFQAIAVTKTEFGQIARLSSADLIAHILRRYHEPHLRDFALAIALAERLEHSEHSHPQCPAGLTQHLRRMLQDLQSHQRKEEGIIFPLLVRGARDLLQGPLSHMSIEHAEVLDQLDVLAHLTRQFKAPEDASGRWRTLYAMCAKIASDLRTHMVIEEEILFPRGR